MTKPLMMPQSFSRNVVNLASNWSRLAGYVEADFTDRRNQAKRVIKLFVWVKSKAVQRYDPISDFSAYVYS